ncbi:hypothetical protein [Wolbachia pipientis]
MTVIRTIIVDDHSSIRVDKYIRKFFPNITQSIIEKFLRKGLIRVIIKKLNLIIG